MTSVRGASLPLAGPSFTTVSVMGLLDYVAADVLNFIKGVLIALAARDALHRFKP